MTMPNSEERGTRTAGGQTGTAREQIREVKDQVIGQAKTTLQQARERAGTSLSEGKSQFADQFGTVAQALRRTSENLRSEDQQRIASLTETVAQRVDQLGNYLRTKDTQAMRQDLENLARRQPKLILGGALLLGLIGARFLKSSKREKRRGNFNYGRDPRFSNPGNSGYSGGRSESEAHFGSGGRYAGD